MHLPSVKLTLNNGYMYLGTGDYNWCFFLSVDVHVCLFVCCCLFVFYFIMAWNDLRNSRLSSPTLNFTGNVLKLCKERHFMAKYLI